MPLCPACQSPLEAGATRCENCLAVFPASALLPDPVQSDTTSSSTIQQTASQPAGMSSVSFAATGTPSTQQSMMVPNNTQTAPQPASTPPTASTQNATPVQNAQQSAPHAAPHTFEELLDDIEVDDILDDTPLTSAHPQAQPQAFTQEPKKKSSLRVNVAGMSKKPNPIHAQPQPQVSAQPQADPFAAPPTPSQEQAAQTPPPAKPKNPAPKFKGQEPALATAALVFAILAIVLPGAGFLCAVAAIITGHLAYKNHASERGWSARLVGIVVAIYKVFSGIIAAFVIAGFLSAFAGYLGVTPQELLSGTYHTRSSMVGWNAESESASSDEGDWSSSNVLNVNTSNAASSPSVSDSASTASSTSTPAVYTSLSQLPKPTDAVVSAMIKDSEVVGKWASNALINEGTGEAMDARDMLSLSLGYDKTYEIAGARGKDTETGSWSVDGDKLRLSSSDGAKRTLEVDSRDVIHLEDGTGIVYVFTRA